VTQIIDLKQLARNSLIRDICDGKVMAQEAYHYQTWTVNAVLDWLEENGYEVRKKDVVIEQPPVSIA
jgi:hypothetical protein